MTTSVERNQVTSYTNDTFTTGAALLKAMAHPLRLAVLVSLLDGPRCVHELVESTTATQPLVSQHLRVLRSAELVSRSQRGREVVYAIADAHIQHIVADTVDHVSNEGVHHEPHVHDA